MSGTWGHLDRRDSVANLVDFLNANAPVTAPYSVTTFGGAGDGTTDDRASFLAADAAAAPADGALDVPPGTYHLASSTALAAGLAFAPGAVLRPASGVVVTLTGPITAGRQQIFDTTAGGSVRCYAQGDVYPEWFGVVANDLSAAAANSVAIAAALAAMADSVSSAMGGALRFGLGAYHFAGPITLTNRVMLVGVNGARGFTTPASAAGGSTLTFPDGSDGIVSLYPTTPYVGRSESTVVEGLRVVARGKTLTTGSGFVFNGRMFVQDCHVDGFALDGYHVDASTAYTPATNANNWSVTGGTSTNNKRHGLYANGADANAGCCSRLDTSDNGGWGILDTSFLGNMYLACHAAGNGSGAYSSTSLTAGNTAFYNCYSESGQPASHVLSPALVFGGLHAAGFTAGSTAGNFGGASGTNTLGLSPAQVVSVPGTTTVTTYVGSGINDQSVLGFTAVADGGASGGYRWRYGKPATGWYGLIHAASDVRQPLAIGGGPAVDSASRSAVGWVQFPQAGFYMGSIRWIYATALPTTGKWTRDDRVYIQNAAPSAIACYVVTTSGDFAGTPPVFKAVETVAP